MPSFIRSSYAATSVLGSTLVYALPQNGGRMIPRAYSAGDIQVVTGSVPDGSPTTTQTTPAPTNPQADAAATTTPHDTVTQETTNTWSITTTSGSVPNPYDNFSALDFSPSATSTSTAAAEHGTLAPAPVVASSHPLSGHGVLAGVVVGGLVFGLLCLTLGLWFCYRRRGPTSGASTPRYTTTVVGDEKPRSKFGQWFKGGSMPFKKSHSRIRSSMSFASPILENDPKMVESNASSVRSPLAPHLSGSTATRGDWNSNHGRWSTFSTSDGSVYPQTPAGGQISGIIMETVIETDAASDPRTPTMAPRRDIDYADMKRSSDERLPALPPLATSFGSGGSPPGSNRYSDGPPTPSTYSSGGLTFGSIGHGSHYIRTSNGITQQLILPTQFNNGSNPKFMTTTTAPLLSSKPRFDPTTRHSGSSTASIDRESGETIKITNPFLDDEDISSYGHGVLEADDRSSIRTMDSDAHGAYPSSTGCLDPKVSPSPSPDAPLTRPRSSLISDSSSDYPYPLGHAVDSDGNVVNPFLRISEILEEVDGRMRWPSPPLLPRAESRNY